MEPYRSQGSSYFFVATTAYVLCLDRATGRELWRTQAFQSGTMSVLLLAEGKLYVTTNGAAACLDEATGKLLWSVRVNGLSPPVGMALDFAREPALLFLSCDGLLFCLNASNGALLWSNGLEGLGYYHISMRVPGAITSQPVWHTVRSGNSSRVEVLEDEQRG